ncbi:restriction endonuclease subunit S [Faecalibacillus faecis]|uniref:restriction endonuclease subunit S n=1 Tax=Faecalibacillus faecis TaxID=1982628 RepID=UPI0035230334
MKYKFIKMEDALETLIDYRGKTPKKSNEGIITLSAKSVKNNYIDYSQCYFISEKEYERFMVRGIPHKGDILITTEAPLGMVARLDREDVAIAQRLLTLRGKQGVLDNDYLLYYLQSPIGQAALKARETGTTVTGIKQAEFRKIEIIIPEFEIQKKIVSILRAIDDKISLNNHINNNLVATSLDTLSILV